MLSSRSSTARSKCFGMVREMEDKGERYQNYPHFLHNKISYTSNIVQLPQYNEDKGLGMFLGILPA